jgi:predicted ATPase/class 3 adenylate cyclase
VAENSFPYPEGERRQITAMFCDLVGSTNLSTQIDPEDYHDIIQGFHKTCTEVVERFGGYIGQYLGDGILVFFGYPSAAEDAAQRAVRSGLEIVDAIRDLNVHLQREYGLQISVRAGIHTGPVVMDEVGRRNEPQAFGETLNIAAWLQGYAKPNTVVVSGATLRLIEGYFLSESQGSQLLKGTTIPMSLHRVVCETGARSPMDVAAMRGLTPLIGRGDIAEQLEAFWTSAKTGRGRAVLLRGEAGVGKSRLVQLLKDRVATENHSWAECRCSSYAQHTSLFPIIDLLHQFLKWEKDDLPNSKLQKLERFLVDHELAVEEAMPLFASLLSISIPAGRGRPLNMTAERKRERTLELLLDLLISRARNTPLLFIVEDLHWIDSGTEQFLDLLINHASEVRILILMTSRPAFQPPWTLQNGIMQVRCNALERNEVLQMVESLTGGAQLPNAVLEQIVAKTDGVPLFIEELTKMVLESGFVERKNGNYSLTKPLTALTIPNTLQDSLMARLDRLEEAKTIAQLAAVLGRRFEVSLLSAVTPLDDTRMREALRQLVDAGLIFPEPGRPEAFVFKHALVRDTAYESLLRQTRRKYHQEIAKILVERFHDTAAGQPELISHHFKGAGLNREAIPWNMRAARTQVARAAYVEARQYSEEALEAFDPAAWSNDYDASADLHLLVAECRYLTQDLEAFNSLFDEIFNKLKVENHRNRLYELKVLILTTRGLPKESVETGLDALCMLGIEFPTDPKLIITAIGAEMETVKGLMGSRKPAQLLSLPPLEDQTISFIIGLVLRIQPAAHNDHQVELFALMALKNLALTLKYGNGLDAPGVYSMVAIVTQVMTDDSQTAYEFSRLAIDLDEKQGRRQTCSVTFIHTYFIAHWVNPLEDSRTMILEGAKAGFESGDLLYACYQTANYVINLSRGGAPLEEIIDVATRHFNIIDNRVAVAGFHCTLEKQMAKALAGLTETRVSLTDKETNEDQELASILRLDNQLGWYFVTKLALHYYYRDFSAAVDYADKALAILDDSQGQFVEVEFVLFDALTQLARYTEVDSEQQEQLLKRAQINLEKLQRWSKLCEANFAHKQLLVEAEFARVRGEKTNAIRLYEAAAQSAAKFKFIQHAALARELAGRYLTELGDLDSAEKWLNAARENYMAWGARAKVEDLESCFPFLNSNR